jgi:hypothetical protein
LRAERWDCAKRDVLKGYPRNELTAHREDRPARKRLSSPMPNEFKTPEEYVSDTLDLMIKAGWAKQHHQSVEGLGVDWD